MTTEFNNGFASGWEMAVPEAFALSLKNKNIDAGEIFYDAQEAYRLQWDEALRHIRFCVQVDAVKADEISFTMWKPNSHKTGVTKIRSATLTVVEFISCLEHGFTTLI